MATTKKKKSGGKKKTTKKKATKKATKKAAKKSTAKKSATKKKAAKKSTAKKKATKKAAKKSTAKKKATKKTAKKSTAKKAAPKKKAAKKSTTKKAAPKKKAAKKSGTKKGQTRKTARKAFTDLTPTSKQITLLKKLARGSKLKGFEIGQLKQKKLIKKEGDDWVPSAKGEEVLKAAGGAKPKKKATKKKATTKKAAPKKKATTKKATTKAAPKKPTKKPGRGTKGKAKKYKKPVKEVRESGRKVSDTTLAACVVGSRSPSATSPKRVSEMKRPRSACGPGAPSPSKAAAIMGRKGGKRTAAGKPSQWKGNPGARVRSFDRKGNPGMETNPQETRKIKNRLLNPNSYMK